MSPTLTGRRKSIMTPPARTLTAVERIEGTISGYVSSDSPGVVRHQFFSYVMIFLSRKSILSAIAPTEWTCGSIKQNLEATHWQAGTQAAVQKEEKYSWRKRFNKNWGLQACYWKALLGNGPEYWLVAICAVWEASRKQDLTARGMTTTNRECLF